MKTVVLRKCYSERSLDHISRRADKVLPSICYTPRIKAPQQWRYSDFGADENLCRLAHNRPFSHLRSRSMSIVIHLAFDENGWKTPLVNLDVIPSIV